MKERKCTQIGASMAADIMVMAAFVRRYSKCKVEFNLFDASQVICFDSNLIFLQEMNDNFCNWRTATLDKQ